MTVAYGKPAILVPDARRAAAVLVAWARAAPPLLLSPPGACAWLGPAGWLALIAQARALCPGVPFGHALDCGAAPGHALAALRAGVPILVLAGAHPAYPAVAGAAAEAGAVLLPAPPPAIVIDHLDLRRPAGRARLRVLLAGP
ncbi:hypothetical protein [Humitalea rosea]|uniref:hypothetical protein n=1 Tax=Humitalea rosea TaxID=990373 RepID=UPI000DAE7FDC|nr:hypothetical protein [Humitalea rosea]